MAAELRALIFDTGGTVFDWHSAVRSALEEVGLRERIEADWTQLAADWRRSSLRQLAEMSLPTGGEMDVDMDEVLRLSLNATLVEHGLQRLQAHCSELVRGWRRMKPWADSAQGISRVRKRYVVASFTILKTALVIESSRQGGVTWDAVFSCEMSGTYKIAPRSYEYPSKWLDLPAENIALVTAHNNDLVAAHQAGYKTVFVERPEEWGGLPSPDAEPSVLADWVAADLEDLALQLSRV